MNIYKIVLTGGPCAGKTKILEKLIKHYSTKENRVFIIPETATEVLSSGLKFVEFDEAINFQNIIFNMQSNKERMLDEGIKHVPLYQNNIIFLDRGIIDNKAYLDSQEQFDSLLKKYNQSELEILDSYDLVIDLISLATTDPELYLEHCRTNEERYEDLETAQIIDKKTTDAWLGHRNVKYVYPTKTLEEKFNIVVNYIDALIESKQKRESEIYLIENPTDLLMKLDDNNSKKIVVIDHYLKKRIVSETNSKTVLRQRIYKQHESNQMVILDESGTTIMDHNINYNYWDYFGNDNALEKEIRRVEYTTNILGVICKISCYDDLHIRNS